MPEAGYHALECDVCHRTCNDEAHMLCRTGIIPWQPAGAGSRPMSSGGLGSEFASQVFTCLLASLTIKVAHAVLRGSLQCK